MQEALIAIAANSNTNLGSFLLGAILVVILVKFALDYYFKWRSQENLMIPDTDRVVLKRESDRHIEAMSQSLQELAKNQKEGSIAQKETAVVMKDLLQVSEKMKQDMAVLLDRGR